MTSTFFLNYSNIIIYICQGPNAVLAFKREGYNLFDFNLQDTLEEISFRFLFEKKIAIKGF
jgi:hypothetical protein